MRTSLPRELKSKPVVLNAVKVSLLVGTTLNLINQAPNVLDGEAISWAKLALNYLVPYLVASYSAAKMRTTAPKSNE